METHIYKNKKYNYLYKITNLVNGKFYYGVHSTDDLNDGYMGSGKLLLRAVEKYGVSNFKKEILEFFDTRDEMFLREKQIVTKELVLNENCYNLTLGGKSSPFFLRDYSDPEPYQKMTQTKIEKGVFSKWSVEWRGYNNPEFISRCKNKYEEDKETFIRLAIETDIPDKLIEQITHKNCHIGKCFAYYESQGWLKKQYETMIKGPSTVSLKKTVYGPFKKAILLEEKAVARLNKLPEMIKFFNDETCSNSQCYNEHKYNFTFNDLKYLEDRGILENRRDVMFEWDAPYNGHITSKRTVFDVNIKNTIIIDKELNLYELTINGSLIQKGRF